MKPLMSNTKDICIEHFRKSTVTRLNVETGRNTPSSKPLMSGVNMPHVDPLLYIDQKPKRISTASFVGRLRRAVYRRRDGSLTIGTAGGQPRVFERFSKPSGMLSSLPVICSDIFTVSNATALTARLKHYGCFLRIKTYQS